MKSLKRLIYGWINTYFLGGCSSYNSLDVRKSCRSKFQARKMFAENNLPHAKGTTFFSPWKAFAFARQHGFPLCIKPNVSGFSRGSHFPITNYKELFRACLMVKIWWPISVIEQYLAGKNYRVTVVKGEIMSVIRRYPPFVDGNGISTISVLIDRENETRAKMKLYPTIYPIPKNRRTRKFLKQKGLSLSTIPEKDIRVELFNRISLAPGGVVEIIDKETMAPENKEMFIKILSLFNANILGIDAIFVDGIETGFKKQSCILLEVNSRPYLKMHDAPRYGKKEDLRSFYKTLNGLSIEQSDIF